MNLSILKVLFIIFYLLSGLSNANSDIKNKQIAYLVSDINIPFWNIMANGIKDKAKKRGYSVKVYSANNIKLKELKNTIKALNSNIVGLVVSPINSLTAVTILKFASKSNIPVSISDIGTNSGNYISFISSNNKKGAYDIGLVLAKKMKEMKIDNGKVGIISIPQKRANGKARTIGFMKALDEYGIKSAGLLQQVDFSYQETYNHSIKLITENKDLKALWLQGSDKYQGALDAINDSGNKGKILLICFDAEPEFLDMISKGELVGAAMQQPYLMGEKAVDSLIDYLDGKKVEKNIQLEVLAISQKNIKEKIDIIKRNVLGQK